MTSLKDLVGRLEASRGPDRDLDADIEIALFRQGWTKSPKAPGQIAETAKHFWPEGRLRFFSKSGTTAPNYTGSLDAAVSLISRLFPDASWMIEPNACRLRVTGGVDFVERRAVVSQGGGECAPAAVCLAVLLALTARRDL